MARVSTFLLFVSTLFCTTCSLAQEEIAPAHAIGKRVEIRVKYKNEDGDFKCVGTVAQVDQKKLILEDVLKTENTNRGVPFLSNLKHQEKLFKNVGAIKTIELEFDIVVPLDRIQSCRIAEPKTGNKNNNWTTKVLSKSDRYFEKISITAKSLRRFNEREAGR